MLNLALSDETRKSLSFFFSLLFASSDIIATEWRSCALLVCFCLPLCLPIIWWRFRLSAVSAWNENFMECRSAVAVQEWRERAQRLEGGKLNFPEEVESIKKALPSCMNYWFYFANSASNPEELQTRRERWRQWMSIRKFMTLSHSK